MSFWSPIRIDELCESYGSGLSYAEIAREIGTTKNAVAGRLTKLVKEAEQWTPDGGDLDAMKDSAKMVFAQVRRALGDQAT